MYTAEELEMFRLCLHGSTPQLREYINAGIKGKKIDISAHGSKAIELAAESGSKMKIMILDILFTRDIPKEDKIKIIREHGSDELYHEFVEKWGLSTRIDQITSEINE